MSVGHDLSQAVHRLVQIMHPFPLPTVDFQPQVLHLFLAELRPGFGLTDPITVLHPSLPGLAASSGFLAVRLEHLVREEALS